MNLQFVCVNLEYEDMDLVFSVDFSASCELEAKSSMSPGTVPNCIQASTAAGCRRSANGGALKESWVQDVL